MPGTVHLTDDKRLNQVGAVGVPPAGAAVARRTARHRGDHTENVPGEGGHAGNPDGVMPGTVHLADDERVVKRRAVHVPPAGAAVARRTARHRADLRIVALVEGGGAGNLDGVMPGAVHLTDDHQLFVAGAVDVPPAGAAVARRTARHRADLRLALVEGSGAGNLDGFTPDTVHLAAHEPLAL